MEDPQKGCTTHFLLRLLGFSGHNWKRNSITDRECKRCGAKYKLIEYDGFFETWKKV